MVRRSVQALFLGVGLCLTLGVAGCGEAGNTVVVDPVQTPEEVQAGYDNYDQQQADADYK